MTQLIFVDKHNIVFVDDAAYKAYQDWLAEDHDDVTPEALSELQAEANKEFEGHTFEIISGPAW